MWVSTRRQEVPPNRQSLGSSPGGSQSGRPESGNAAPRFKIDEVNLWKQLRKPEGVDFVQQEQTRRDELRNQ